MWTQDEIGIMEKYAGNDQRDKNEINGCNQFKNLWLNREDEIWRPQDYQQLIVFFFGVLYEAEGFLKGATTGINKRRLGAPGFAIIVLKALTWHKDQV